MPRSFFCNTGCNAVPCTILIVTFINPIIPFMAFNTVYYRIICFWLPVLLVAIKANAQYYPSEGSKLNYRLIGFTLPETKNTVKYTVEIAWDSVNTETDFKKNKFKAVSAKSNNIKTEVPSFRGTYTWRASYTDDKGKIVKDNFIHFTTLTCPAVDTSSVRLRVITKAGRYNNAYVFSDNTRVLYDMKGQPVWFLPDIKEKLSLGGVVRDLKLTPQGTITFLLNDWPYEVNYEGKILWEAPIYLNANNKKEHYHHEFTRLDNGNYMVMGMEILKCRLNASKDSLPHICEGGDCDDTSNGAYRKMSFGTIVEYNAQHELVWSWKSSNLFRNNSLYPFINNSEPGFEIHNNAFYLDTKEGALYISSKHYSIIIKVNYPSGDVAAIYGSKNTINNNPLFCQQHSCRVTKSGNITLFNNNECNIGEVPAIVVLQRAGQDKQELKKVWEFKCPVTYTGKQKGRQHIATTGGNVIELEDKNLFASMCSPYSNIFIVSPAKQILWNSVLEKKEGGQAGKWLPASQYRAFIITKEKSIDNLIFSHR